MVLAGKAPFLAIPAQQRRSILSRIGISQHHDLHILEANDIHHARRYFADRATKSKEETRKTYDAKPSCFTLLDLSEMITKYITQITASFNPLSASRTHKIPRLILSRLPASPAPGAAPIKVTTNILPQSSTQAGRVAIGFRDGKEIVFDGGDGGEAKGGAIDLKALAMGEVIEELDRHSRALRRKEEIGN